MLKHGGSHTLGLEPKTVDARGRVSWTWEVPVSTTPGAWRVVYTAGRASLKAELIVRDPIPAPWVQGTLSPEF